MKKITLSAIGAFMILLAVYLWPTGMDILILYLTKIMGTQLAAWTALYFICFGLLFVGWALGGARLLGIKRLVGIFKLLLRNPIGLAVLLIALFVIFQIIGGQI